MSTHQDNPTNSVVNPSLQHAQVYAERGWRVAPVAPGGNHPCITGWPDLATTDPNQIQEWFVDPTMGVSIATGAESGIFVLDIDEGVHPDGCPKMGFDSLSELEQRHGRLPDTYTVLTPSGGEHRYYRYPEELPDGMVLTNSASHVGIDLDIRSDRGQVIAPPSRKTHGSYVRELSSPDEVADAPLWLIELACTPRPEPREQNLTPRTDRPGDQWAATVTWSDLLVPEGFVHVRTDGSGVDHWRVPNASNPVGATTGFGDLDCLHMFSSSYPPVPAETTLSKFGFLTATRFNGDFEAAARWCSQQGFGTCDNTPIEDLFEPAAISPTNTAPAEATTEATAWQPPLALAPPTPLPTFPEGVFPDWMEAGIDEVASKLGAPRDLPAITSLGAAVTITTGRLEVDVDGQQIEQGNLYLLMVAAPSTGKSPAWKMTSDYHKSAHDEYVSWVTPLLEANKDAIETAESELMTALKGGDRDIIAFAREQLMEAQKRPTEPVQLQVGDATPEALEIVLERNCGGVTVADTEGGVFTMMAGRYSDKEAPETYLKGFSSDEVNVERVTRKPVHIRQATLSMMLCVQPVVLRELGARPGFTGRGLTDRFMYAVPHFTALWQRDLIRHRVSPDASAVMDEYNQRAQGWAITLLRQQPGQRLRLTLSEPALHVWSTWFAQTAQRAQRGSDLEGEEQWLSKLNVSVVRLAAVLHSLHGYGPDQEIPEEILERAIAVGDYWAAHKIHVAATWRALPGLHAARSILAWATTPARSGRSWTVRDFHRDHQQIFSTVDDITPGIDLLVERGWIRTVPTPENPGRGRPTVRYETHPDARPEDAEADTTTTTTHDTFNPLPPVMPSIVIAPNPDVPDDEQAPDWEDPWDDRDDETWPEEDWPAEDPFQARQAS